MKLTMLDPTGEERDIEALMMGIVVDLHRINQRLINVETMLGLVPHETPEAAEEESNDD